MTNLIEIYQTSDGQTQVEVRFEQETVWLSQVQIVARRNNLFYRIFPLKSILI
ncbi:hypothetical protein [Neisseria animalis]|uniref:hypothetical protein n=1 Tax=Neisseria animalis TaxID=492 RepID=UPI000F6DC082|nr:hypothetical protein [Neisseria animalis]VEE09106.1 Virulence protein [Neisseria animalis]